MTKSARRRRAPAASVETVTALEEGVNDMSDTPEELDSYAPPLRGALALLEGKCGALFSESDAAAIKQQRRHRLIVVAFCVFGTFAVVFSILDVTRLLPLEGHESLTRGLAVGLFAGEVVTVSGALAAALVGLRYALQGNWLEGRHRAEMLRLLKFRMLLDPSLVGGGAGGGLAEWESKLAAEFDAVERIDESTLHEWIEETRAPDLPMCTPAGAIDERMLGDVVAYYRRKRLDPQASYFYRQAARNLRRDWSTRLVPPLLFFASVFFALVHLVLEVVEMFEQHFSLSGYAQEWAHGRSAVGVTLVILAAALPTFGAGLRGLRAAYEFSRNTVRFRALHFALELLRERVSREGAKPEEVWRDLWWCEWLLEAEHREWLRLMIEAEWIG
ncbi:MAG: hypothetical protein LC746_18010 [Acidobacteria bacterium]|nr:hypothetical protein [Acidobacteriota bacterium]